MIAPPPTRSIVAIAGDAGGAAALAPVLRRLAQDADRPLRPFGYREAPAVWRSAGIDCTPIPAAADDAWLAERLAGAGLLLTATSANGIDWERRATHRCCQAHIQTLAVLDFWSNYRLRFADRDGTLLLPDRIAVMDELARAEMAAQGFPAERLVVTGQPVFDALSARRDGCSAVRRQQLRQAAGVEDDELLVLYASQPFADLYGGIEGARTALGYDENEVYELCAAALADLAQHHRRRLVMALRRHPRETAELPAPLGNDCFRTVVSSEPDRLDAVLAADLVLGMNSMLLMEAVLLGQIVVSVQPQLRIADPLPTNRDGRSIAVRAAADLTPALERTLFDATWRTQHLLNLQRHELERDATAKVVALAHQLIAATTQ